MLFLGLDERRRLSFRHMGLRREEDLRNDLRAILELSVFVLFSDITLSFKGTNSKIPSPALFFQKTRRIQGLDN